MRVKNKKRLQAQRGKQTIYHKGRLIWLSGFFKQRTSQSYQFMHVNIVVEQKIKLSSRV